MASQQLPCKPGCRLGLSAPSSPVSLDATAQFPELLFVFLLSKQFAKKWSQSPRASPALTCQAGSLSKGHSSFARAAFVFQVLPRLLALPRLKAAGMRKPTGAF